jgi:hypothetical protein
VYCLKKLAIVGSGPETRELAPFNDPSVDIWVFNEAANSAWCKRWDACFQMHEPDIYQGHNTKDAHHWEWLQQKHGKPVYMQEVDPLIPDSVRYPLEDAKALAGVQMFPTTFAYMAAFAIMQGYEQIGFWGVELSASEYQYQANGYLFWFGFLRGRLGAENVDSAVLHVGKNIFEVPLYGYEGNYAFGVEYFAERVRLLDNQWNAANKSAMNIRKAIERAIERSDCNKVPDLVKSYQASIMECGEYAGALAEAERYQTFGSRYADRGGFESTAARAQMDGEAKRVLMWTALGKAEYIWNVWNQSKSAAAGNQLITAINQVGELAQETGAILGMYHENISYINKYDDAVQAGGAVLLEATA